MIENIWQKIWARIEKDPSKLRMDDFFSLNGRGLNKCLVEVGFDKQCGSACCILGWSWLIAQEEGVDCSDVNYDDMVVELFGENVGWCGSGEINDSLWYVFYNMTDEQAYEEVKRRALI